MDVVAAVCLSIVGLSFAGLIVVGVEPRCLVDWLYPPLEEVPATESTPEVPA